MLNKYFHGYQSGLSIALFTESIEFHYEGLDDKAKDTLKRGLTDLLSECGRGIHRDELFNNKPLDLSRVNVQQTNRGTSRSRAPSNSSIEKQNIEITKGRLETSASPNKQ